MEENTNRVGSVDVIKRGPRERLIFLDYLRSAAVLLVLWDHLVGQWLGWRGRGWVPLELVDRFGTTPLLIIQNFGWLGVALFFLISGFIISHTGSQESRPEFAVKRLFRIYPPLLFAVFVALLVEHARSALGVLDSGTRTVPAPHSVTDALWSSSLLNYLRVDQQPVLFVAWTLVIEMSFYILVFVVRPLLVRRGLASWLILAFVLGALLTMKTHGPNWFLLVVSLSYVPILVLGQAMWLRWSNRIPPWEFVAITAAAWAEFVFGLERIQPTFLAPQNAYGPSVATAYAIFCIALLRRGQMKERRVVRALANRSYSIYLLHGPIGLIVLDSSIQWLPFTAALFLALAAVAVAVEVSYRLVERRSQRAARKIVFRIARGAVRSRSSPPLPGPDSSVAATLTRTGSATERST